MWKRKGYICNVLLALRTKISFDLNIKKLQWHKTATFKKFVNIAYPLIRISSIKRISSEKMMYINNNYIVVT